MLAAAAATALLAASAATPFRIHFDNGEFAQVAHNVACLGATIPCTKPLIEKFWHAELPWSPEDQRHIDAWRNTLGAVSARQPKAEPAPFLANYGGYFPEVAAQHRLIAAALDSHSPRAFERKAAGLAEPPEIATLSAALRHFQRRMRPWWKAKGARYLAAHAGAVQAGMGDPKFAALAGKIARFMESEVTTRDFYVHLIARGDPRESDAMGTFVRNHIVLELTDSMEPSTARTIIMHEMTHAFYDTAPRARHRELIAAFAASPEPRAQSYYSILNEALATAVQFRLLGHAPEKDQEDYRHPYIPRLGRSSLLPLEHALDDPAITLFNGFLNRYLSAATAAMGEDANTPKFALLALAKGLVGEAANLRAADAEFDRDFAALGFAGFDERQRFSQLNLVMFVTYADLPGISSNWPEIEELAKQHQAFVFVAPRAGKGSVFVVAGRDSASLTAAVRQMAEARALPERGLVVSGP